MKLDLSRLESFKAVAFKTHGPPPRPSACMDTYICYYCPRHGKWRRSACCCWRSFWCSCFQSCANNDIIHEVFFFRGPPPAQLLEDRQSGCGHLRPAFLCAKETSVLTSEVVDFQFCSQIPSSSPMTRLAPSHIHFPSSIASKCLTTRALPLQITNPGKQEAFGGRE